MKNSEVATASDKTVSHRGHRERLREKFITHGAECLATHELLELLLFSCVPRRNTNDIAHGMLSRFGSLERVLSASVEELESVNYISRGGAVQIKLVNELVKRCALDRAQEIYRYDSLEKVGTLILSIFGALSVEKLYMILFDGQMRLIDCVHICDGNVASVNMCARTMAKYIIDSNAVNVVLAHNHPGGLAVPSRDDIAITRQLEIMIGHLGANFVAHIIVSGERYAPINNINTEFFKNLV